LLGEWALVRLRTFQVKKTVNNALYGYGAIKKRVLSNLLKLLPLAKIGLHSLVQVIPAAKNGLQTGNSLVAAQFGKLSNLAKNNFDSFRYFCNDKRNLLNNFDFFLTGTDAFYSLAEVYKTQDPREGVGLLDAGKDWFLRRLAFKNSRLAMPAALSLFGDALTPKGSMLESLVNWGQDETSNPKQENTEYAVNSSGKVIGGLLILAKNLDLKYHEGIDYTPLYINSKKNRSINKIFGIIGALLLSAGFGLTLNNITTNPKQKTNPNKNSDIDLPKSLDPESQLNLNI
jgi:hypothetical protein